MFEKGPSFARSRGPLSTTVTLRVASIPSSPTQVARPTGPPPSTTTSIAGAAPREALAPASLPSASTVLPACATHSLRRWVRAQSRRGTTSADGRGPSAA